MTDEELKNLFAKSDSSIASLAASGREADRKIAATNASLAETNASLAESGREADRKIAATNADLAAKIAATDASLAEKIDKITEQIGGISNNIGYHAEQFFQNVLADKKVFGGIEYDDIILNMMHREKNGKVEFDIVLENVSSVALIEVKNRIHPSFVKELAEERIEKFREYFPRYKDFDVYLGIAGFSFSGAVLEEARKYGVGIIRQVGDGIEVDAAGLKAYR